MNFKSISISKRANVDSDEWNIIHFERRSVPCEGVIL